MDIFTYVKSLSFDAIKVEKKSENSSEIRKRIEGAREIQRVRYKEAGISCNSDMNSSMIKKYCTLTDSTRLLMEQVYNKYHLSARAYNKILKVARTIADLNGSTSIRECEVIEAIQYRRFLNSEII